MQKLLYICIISHVHCTCTCIHVCTYTHMLYYLCVSSKYIHVYMCMYMYIIHTIHVKLCSYITLIGMPELHGRMHPQLR